MKATIIGKPHFEVEVTQGMVEGLLELSQAHYDGTCKAAGHPGGLLWGWKNQATWSRESGDPLVVSGSFRELDLTLKICECLTVIGGRPYYKEIQEYRAFIACLLRRANELTSWKEEMNSALPSFTVTAVGPGSRRAMAESLLAMAQAILEGAEHTGGGAILHPTGEDLTLQSDLRVRACDVKPVFITEWLTLSQDGPTLERKPLSSWPSWAHELTRGAS